MIFKIIDKMEYFKSKFEKQVQQFCDTHNNENMPTIRKNEVKDKRPNFELLYDKNEGIIGNKFYEEFNDFADNYRETEQTDIGYKITMKKYEVIKVTVKDVTSQTIDS